MAAVTTAAGSDAQAPVSQSPVVAKVIQSPRISACLIAKNEEAFLCACLESLAGEVDEIVVVDTGSTDRTVEIATAAGAKVVHEEWKNDFSVARNRALDEATGDWVLVVDADERLASGQAGRLRELVSRAEAEGYDGYLVQIVNFPDNEEARTITHRVGLFRRRPEYRWEGKIHEQIGPAITRHGGRIVASDLKFDHYGYDPRVRKAKGKEARNTRMILQELRKNPGNPFMHYNLGQEHYGAGRFEEAVVHLRRAIWYAPVDKVPYGPTTVYRLVDSLARLGRWEEALRVCDQYEPILPDYTDLRFLDGVVSFHAGEYQRALASLLRAVGQGESPADKYDQVHAGAGSYKAWWYIGQLYERVRQDQKALAAYTGALQAEPRYLRALKSWLEAAFRVAAGNPEVVYDALLKNVDVGRIGDRGAEVVYTAFLNLRGWEHAARVLDWEVWKQKQFERLHREALILLAQGRAEEAAARLDEALGGGGVGGTWTGSNSAGASSEDPEGLRGLRAEWGVALVDGTLAALAAGHWATARDYLARLRDDGEKGAHADVLEYVLDQVSQDDDQPRQDKDKNNVTDLNLWLIGVLSEGDPLHEQAAWEILSRTVFLGLGRKAEATMGYLLRLGVGEAVIRRRLGEILFALNQPDLGVQFLLEAALQGEHTDESLALIALHASRKGFLTEAENVMRAVVQARPNDPVAVVRLAQILLDQGKAEEAYKVVDEARRHQADSAILRSWLATHAKLTFAEASQTGTGSAGSYVTGRMG
ncbi:MAG: glycosyltransferase [Bacteroidota bacterium]